jgi:hypothetical protein
MTRSHARRWHTFAVQRLCDRAERSAGRVVPEDPPNDLGLAIVDLDAAAERATLLIDTRDGVVPVRNAAGREARERTALESSQGLVAQISAKEFQALQIERDALDGDWNYCIRPRAQER